MQHRARPSWLSELRAGPESDESVLEWLCVALHTFDYGSADIEPLYGWLVAKFERDWPGTHVWSAAMEPYIGEGGLPSLGLFLALTAPREVEVAVFEEDYSIPLVDSDQPRLETIACVTRFIEAHADHLIPPGLEPRANIVVDSFTSRLLARCEELGADPLTGASSEIACEQILERMRRWPTWLRVFPRQWLPDALAPWPMLVKCCAVLSLPTAFFEGFDARAARELDSRGLLRHITRLRVSLEYAEDWVSELFFSEVAFPALEHLSITQFSGRATAHIAAARDLGNLRELELVDACYDPSVCLQPLVASGMFDRLERLWIGQSEVVNLDTLATSSAVEPGGQLKEIAIRVNVPTGALLEQLTSYDRLAGVEVLCFDSDGSCLPASSPPIREQEPDAVPFQGLRTLSLQEVRQLDSQDIQGLIERVDLSKLRVLVAEDEVPARELLGAMSCDELERLYLGRSGLGNDFIAALATKHRFPKLEWLDVSLNGLQKTGLEAICSAPWSRQLRGLRVGSNQLGGALGALGRARDWSRLLVLDLCRVELDARDLRELGSSSCLPVLSNLNLSLNQLDLAAFSVLVGSTWFSQLDRLSLSGCELSPAHIQRLCSVRNLTRLTRLDLSHNVLGARALDALGHAPFAKSLRCLDLFGVELDEHGVEALARADFAGLRVFRVSGRDLDEAAVRELARAPWARGLRSLVIHAC